MEEATWCVLLVVGHRKRGGQSSKDPEVPDVIRVGYFRKAWVIWAPGYPVIRCDLVSSVFVLIFGQFSAPGVNLLDRLLTVASPLWLVLVFDWWWARSVIGVG